jgi:hypothetical protein
MVKPKKLNKLSEYKLVTLKEIFEFSTKLLIIELIRLAKKNKRIKDVELKKISLLF